jgi:outer membrane biosynthesis protein TonB
MYENKSFQLAILVSVLLHFTVFLSAPYVGVMPKKQLFEPIKVAYLKVKEKEPPKKLVVKKAKSSHYQVFPPVAPEALPEVRKEDIANPLPIFEPLRQTAPKQEQVKKEEPTVETIGPGLSGRAVIGGNGDKFETVVNNEKDSGRKATYISYYRSVREKIRYYADKNYIKEGSASQGEIFLSFVVTSGGDLLHIMIIDAKSAEDLLLRNLAINSIRDASPFPAFPQGMTQHQITFNVVISFELNK